MLMKWEDLEPGDIIKLTKVALDKYGGQPWACCGEVILKRVQVLDEPIAGEHIRFWFRDNRGDRYIYTDYDGKFNGVTMFEIVFLKG